MNIFLGYFSSNRYEEMKKKKNIYIYIYIYILGANWMGYCPNYIVRGENSSELGYCIFRSSRKATGGFEKKKWEVIGLF